MSVHAILAVALAAIAASSGPTHALQEAPVKPAAPSLARDGDDAKLTEAQRRFHRGIELYKNGDFAAAQAEFTRAYDLVPNYKILYNLGQVTYQRHDHAAALRYLRQYLRDGVDQISAERRHEVTGDITDLEQRIARLQIDTAEEGAEVFVDDVLVGKTPLRALIAVNGGPRKIDLVARTGEHRSRQVDVGSGEIVRVPFPRLTRFPTDDVEVDYDQRRTHGFALATDGLLIGTAVMTTVSLYLTIRDPR